MRIPIHRLLRTLPLALAACLTVLSACDDEEDRFIIPDRSPLDIWLDDVNYVDATNVPQVQIDRFVAANGIDTTVTETGLVYEMLTDGSGVSPSPTDTVVVNYRGYLVNGAIFDESTVQGPLRGPADGFIAAWNEGIQFMRPGGRMWMIVRPSLGYGSRGRASAGIGGSSVIVFEIDLVEVVPGP